MDELYMATLERFESKESSRAAESGVRAGDHDVDEAGPAKPTVSQANARLMMRSKARGTTRRGCGLDVFAALSGGGG